MYNMVNHYKRASEKNSRCAKYKLRCESAGAILISCLSANVPVPPGPHFFTERIVNIWNCLPSDTVDFSSLTALKHTIICVDVSDFLNFT